MDANWVAAIASAASAFVVAVAAIAALVQIRHARNANDITIYLRLLDRLDSPKTTAAFAAIERFSEKLDKDARLSQRLSEAGPVPEFEEIASLVRFLDDLTMLVLAGGVTERLILVKYTDDIVRLWDSLAEVIYLRRRVAGKHFGRALEHLAMRAAAYRESGDLDRFYQRLGRDPGMADCRAHRGSPLR